MRRFIAHILLFVFLFANTELHEFAKLGAFVGHFMEHRQEDKNLGLVEFIVIHYFSGNVVDADYSRDMQLPFKTIDCNNSIPTCTLPQADYWEFTPITFLEPRPLLPYDQSALPSSYLADIWQPPKSC